jgi:hypothetical protein
MGASSVGPSSEEEVDMLPHLLRTWIPAISLLAALAGCDQSGGSGGGVQEALKAPPPEVPDDFKANPKPRPEDLKPPTDAEFAAWNRKDPEGEKHLYKWDKANGARMLGYWEEMECFREKVMEEGQKAFGAEPGSPVEEQWFQFKKAYVIHLDGWQMRLFAKEPRVMEKSKLIGHFLEAHEMVMNNYPKAYNDADKSELEKVEAHWVITQNKVKKYIKSLGVEWIERDPNNPKDVEAHRKVCEAAFEPPDRSGKAKRGAKKGPI